jgi:hypothetical protein
MSSATPPTLPAGLVLRLAADLLHARRLRLLQQLAGPRSAVGKAPSRRQEAEHLLGQVQTIRTSLQAAAEVPTVTAGLLLAWCGGHQPALALLEDVDRRVLGLHSEDYVGGCRLLLGARRPQEKKP